MARRRFFNRNQPRDRKGRWTRGAGSSAKRKRAPRKKMTPEQARRIGRNIGTAAFVGARVLAPAARSYVAGRAARGSGGTVKVRSYRLDNQMLIGR